MDERKEHGVTVICALAIVAGIILHLYYVIQVPYNMSPHDLGVLSDWKNIEYGHLGYIQYLYQYGVLPDLLEGQFYHPPLFHIIGAFIISVALKYCQIEAAMEYVQLANMIFACITIFYGFRILKKIQIKGLPLIIGTIYLTFCPAFYIIGTELNNDCLMTMFVVIAIYAMLNWIENHSLHNIIKVAVCVALGMLSKTSGVLIAPAIAAVFLYCFIKEKEDRKQLFIQYFIFGCICIPLGLSWVIRQNILFGVPFSYVLRMSNDSPQYLGMCSWIERIGIPSKYQLSCISIDFARPRDFANIWGSTILTSNFDEGLLHINAIYQIFLCWAMTILKYIIIAVLLFCCIKLAFNTQSRVEHKLLILIGMAVLLGSYVRFAFEYPFICTMNIRYITICGLLMISAMGLELGTVNKKIVTIPVFIMILLYSGIASFLYMVCAI